VVRNSRGSGPVKKAFWRQIVIVESKGPTPFILAQRDRASYQACSKPHHHSVRIHFLVDRCSLYALGGSVWGHFFSPGRGNRPAALDFQVQEIPKWGYEAKTQAVTFCRGGMVGPMSDSHGNNRHRGVTTALTFSGHTLD